MTNNKNLLRTSLALALLLSSGVVVAQTRKSNCMNVGPAVVEPLG